MASKPNVPDVIIPRIGEEWYSGNGIPDGWFPLIEELDAEIAKIAPDYKILQAKEKFWGLRYYIDNVTAEQREKIAPLIAEAEGKSYDLCIDCGAEAEQNKPGTFGPRFCAQHANR